MPTIELSNYETTLVVWPSCREEETAVEQVKISDTRMHQTILPQKQAKMTHDSCSYINREKMQLLITIAQHT